MSVDSAVPLVSVRNLTKYFFMNTTLLDRLDPNTRTKKVHAVDGVDLDIHAGEVVGVVGESGCGKSTLARTILRLIEPTSGEIYFDGENVMEYDNAEIKQFRRKAQMIYQDPTAALNPRHTVRRLVKTPMRIQDIGESDDDRDRRAVELIERVGLEEEHLDTLPHKLSGGQKQRVAIARALSINPSLLVADEPTSTLDASVQARILNLLNRLQREENLTMLFISHDLSVIRHFTERIAVMYLGQIVEQASTKKVFEDPSHPYTETLFSSIPVPDPSRRRQRIRLEGNVPSPIDLPTGCRFHTRCPKQIPPADWPESQEVWLEFFGVKKSIERIIEESDDRADRQVDVDRILGSFDPDEMDELHRRTADVISETRDRLADHDLEGARDLLDSAFVSPCEETTPPQLRDGEGSLVRCLLYEDTGADDAQRPEPVR